MLGEQVPVQVSATAVVSAREQRHDLAQLLVGHAAAVVGVPGVGG
jgi:hypothetical protein